MKTKKKRKIRRRKGRVNRKKGGSEGEGMGHVDMVKRGKEERQRKEVEGDGGRQKRIEKKKERPKNNRRKKKINNQALTHSPRLLLSLILAHLPLVSLVHCNGHHIPIVVCSIVSLLVVWSPHSSLEEKEINRCPALFVLSCPVLWAPLSQQRAPIAPCH